MNTATRLVPCEWASPATPMYASAMRRCLRVHWLVVLVQAIGMLATRYDAVRLQPLLHVCTHVFPCKQCGRLHDVWPRLSCHNKDYTTPLSWLLALNGIALLLILLLLPSIIDMALAPPPSTPPILNVTRPSRSFFRAAIR